MGEREGGEVVEGEGEEGRGGEEGDEAVAVVVEGGGERKAEGGELGGGESGEGTHDDGFYISVLVITHEYDCGILWDTLLARKESFVAISLSFRGENLRSKMRNVWHNL